MNLKLERIVQIAKLFDRTRCSPGLYLTQPLEQPAPLLSTESIIDNVLRILYKPPTKYQTA